MEGHFEGGVDFFDVPGHLARVAARAVGANDKGDHAEIIAAKVWFGKFPKLSGVRQGCSEGRPVRASSREIQRPKPET